MSEIIERVDNSVKDNFTFLYQGSGSDSWKNAWFAQYGKIIIFSCFSVSFNDFKSAFKSFFERVNLNDGSWNVDFYYTDTNNKIKQAYFCGSSTWAELWVYKNFQGEPKNKYLVYRYNKSGSTVSVEDNFSGSGINSSDSVTMPQIVLYAK